MEFTPLTTQYSLVEGSQKQDFLRRYIDGPDQRLEGSIEIFQSNLEATNPETQSLTNQTKYLRDLRSLDKSQIDFWF